MSIQLICTLYEFCEQNMIDKHCVARVSNHPKITDMVTFSLLPKHTFEKQSHSLEADQRIKSLAGLFDAHVHQAIICIIHTLHADSLRRSIPTACAALASSITSIARHSVRFRWRRSAPPPRTLRQHRTILYAQAWRHGATLEIIRVEVIITHTFVTLSRDLKGRGHGRAGGLGCFLWSDKACILLGWLRYRGDY